MTYPLEINVDNPVAVWPLDATTAPFPNTAGTSSAASTWGTAVDGTHPALVSGNGAALVMGGAGGLKFSTGLFLTGYEKESFTLEAWFKPIKVTSEVTILGRNQTALDGITFDGNKISFKTVYATTGTCSADYEVGPFLQSYHVVGVHTVSKNVLYVNGVVVASSDITAAQQADIYATAEVGFLYSGKSATATNKYALDAPALYKVPLGPEVVFRHFTLGQGVDTTEAIVSQRGGIVWHFSDTNRSAVWESEWQGQDWANSSTTDIIITNNGIVPNADPTNLSYPGIWLGAIVSDFGGSTSLAGARVEWDGDGSFIIESSVDTGTTWQTCTNGNLVPGTVGLNPTGSIEFRITFAGNITNDASIVRSLYVIVYNDFSVAGSRSDRSAAISGAVYNSTLSAEPIQHDDFGGAVFNGGKFVVSPDQNSVPFTTFGIEAWVKFNSLSSAATIFDLRTSTTTSAPFLGWTGSAGAGQGITLYVNGVATAPASFIPVVGRRYHLFLVLSASSNAAITVGQKYDGTQPLQAMITNVSIFNKTFTAQDVASIYAAYQGVVLTNYIDPSFPQIVEKTGNPYTIYSYDWSIISGSD